MNEQFTKNVVLCSRSSKQDWNMQMQLMDFEPKIDRFVNCFFTGYEEGFALND